MKKPKMKISSKSLSRRFTPVTTSQQKKKIEEERSRDRAEQEKEAATVEVDLEPELDSPDPKRVDDPGQSSKPEPAGLLSKREGSAVLIPKDTKKVKVTMGQVSERPESQGEQQQRADDGDIPGPNYFFTDSAQESKLKTPDQPRVGAQESGGLPPNGLPDPGSMMPMMYPYPGYGTLYCFSTFLYMLICFYYYTQEISKI